MKTVKEISAITGLSIRTLRYYDRIGLLHPAAHSEAGYRLYDDTSLERLQQIMLYRELGFPLAEIRRMLDAPDFDRTRALNEQIAMLERQKEHLENLILFATGIKLIGVNQMDFSVFNKEKLDEYARRAKEQYGDTEAYREWREKHGIRSDAEEQVMAQDFMRLFTELGALRGEAPDSEPVQRQIGRIQAFITEHLYTCTDQILRGLGRMYASGGEITENIDKAGGEGTAALAAAAVEVYCDRRNG